jgi:hypothetical protein
MDQDSLGIGGILKSAVSLGLEKITFGSGVVGKMTTSLMAILTVVGAALLLSLALGQLPLAYICLGVCVFVYLFTQISIMLFASKHPAAATLEGAEFVRYHQVEMAAKGLALPTQQPNVEPPMIEAVGMNDQNVQPEHKVGEVSDQP